MQSSRRASTPTAWIISAGTDYMTGTRAGAIDFDWLMEHIRVRAVEIDAPDADDEDGFAPIEVQTFCLDAKALPAS